MVPHDDHRTKYTNRPTMHVIMTNQVHHPLTQHKNRISYLTNHNHYMYFGAEQNQVTFFLQERSLPKVEEDVTLFTLSIQQAVNNVTPIYYTYNEV
jgi:hypothetical protein